MTYELVYTDMRPRRSGMQSTKLSWRQWLNLCDLGQRQQPPSRKSHPCVIDPDHYRVIPDVGRPGIHYVMGPAIG